MTQKNGFCFAEAVWFARMSEAIRPMSAMESTTLKYNTQQELVRDLFNSVTPVLLLSLVVGIAIFPVLSHVAPKGALGLWLAVLMGVTVYRAKFVSKVRAAMDEGEDPGSADLRHFLITTFFEGCVWGSLLLFLRPEQDILYHAIVFVLLLGLSLTSLIKYSTQPFLHMAFIFPVLIPLAVWGFSQQGLLYQLAGALALSYLAMQLVLLAVNWKVVTMSATQLAEREMRLGQMRQENSDLQRKVQSSDFTELELMRDRQLFVDGPVVMYRCGAERHWPIERISSNIRQFGYEAEELQRRGVGFADLIHPEDLPYVMSEEFTAGTDGLQGMKLEYRLRRKDGTYCWVYDYTIPVYDDSGVLTHLDGYLLDIARLYEANEALAKEKERVQVTLESIGDAVITTNTYGRIDFMNSVAEQLTGWTFSLARYSKLSDVFRVRQGAGHPWLDDPIETFLESSDLGDGRQKEAELHSRQGFRSLITYNAAPIRSHADQVIGYVLVFLDVTDKVDLQRELEYQARHDALTGLLNRREFEKRLKESILSAQKEKTEHVLLYIDLDQFKLVNDTCGHGAGDELLIQLTHSLIKYIRPEDTFARLGGDEFGVLLNKCGLEKGLEVAQIIRAAVKDYQFVWDGRCFDIGASIGLVSIDKHSKSINEVMSAADVACYSAKDTGRNRVRVYEGSDKDLHQREVEMDWATRISQSIENGLLTLYYQDIVPVKKKKHSRSKHIEVLLRIQDVHGNHVTPEAFLSSAERYNLMPSLDRWVVRHSFEWFHRGGFNQDMLMAINLSGLTLNDFEFVSYVVELFNEFDVPPSSVCFEVTETAAIANLKGAAEFIEELKQLGCRFALDDFGSGLSSFAYLKALPVDFLKIDGNFVRDIIDDEVDRAMVGAINNVGHTLKLKTVAEFVNDEKILKVLDQLGVDYAQGYAIAKPKMLSTLVAPKPVFTGLPTEHHAIH